MRYILVLTVLLTASLSYADTDSLPAADAEIKPQTLSPSMRIIDRDWSYFESVPCETIEQTKAHSEQEQRLITRRKHQCINRYKAFFSQPIERR